MVIPTDIRKLILGFIDNKFKEINSIIRSDLKVLREIDDWLSLFSYDRIDDLTRYLRSRAIHRIKSRDKQRWFPV